MSKKALLHVKSNLVALAAVLILFVLTSGLQYFFTWQGIENEKANMERMEQNIKAEKISRLKNEIEMAISNVAVAYEQQLDQPEGIYDISIRLLRNNPHMVGVCVAYMPEYFPDRDRLFAPYVFRQEGQYFRRLLVFDYTKREWYATVMQGNAPTWTEPYEDEGGLRIVMTSFGYPLKNKEGRLVAVLAADVPVSELASTVSGGYSKVSQRSIVILFIQLFGILLIGIMAWRAARSFMRMEQVTKENVRISDELEIGHRLQDAIIPMSLPKHPNVDLAGKVVTAHEVSGGFYDVVLLDNRLFFCLGDVSNNGVGAALAMAITRSVYRTVIGMRHEPSTILNEMNRALSEINERQMFATLFVGVLDLTDGTMHYCNGGHQQPFLVGTYGARSLESAPNVPVGITEWDFEEGKYQMSPGEQLFLFSNGVIEVRNLQGDMLGAKRLLLHLKNGGEAGDTAVKLLKRVEGVISRFAESDNPTGDRVLLSIRYLRQ